MTTTPSQQPDGTEPPTVPVIDIANRLLMVRPVDLLTGIFTADSGERFGIVTLRDQGTTFTAYLPSKGLRDWRAVFDQLQRDVDAPTGRGLIVPGIQRANGHPGLSHG
jgi:hypothetical protein